MDIFTPVSDIPKVGPVYQKRLKRLGIKTIKDLLYHFPVRYDDFSRTTPLKDVKAENSYCLKAKIVQIETTRTFKRRLTITRAILSDDTGSIMALWFNQPYLDKTLLKQETYFFVGKVVAGKKETYLSNPSYEKESETNLHSKRLVPVYRETSRLTSRLLRYFIKNALLNTHNLSQETIPQNILEENNLLDIYKSFWQIHFPDSLEKAEQAKKRFIFDDLFHISLMVLKERWRINKEKSVPVETNLELVKRFVDSLPFKLTDAQRKAAWVILKDIAKPRPMNRLLQGDVGSGKTVVAIIAALNCAKLKYQTAVMAPTEILAKQHFQLFEKLLHKFGLNIGLLTGKEDLFFSKKLKGQSIEISRKKLLEKSESGDIDILIGTHALIQKEVRFNNLSLVVLDEQHRFGVEQRAKLCKNYKTKKRIPHLLSMTATPIPRTLALTIYGDLDLSLIDEMPKERKKVITEIVSEENRQEVYSFIKKEIKKGRKVFVICPRIDPSEETDAPTVWSNVKSATEEYEKLSKEIFPDFKIGLIHGKIPIKEKEKIMRDFKGTKLDILVATSVIEVGIDVSEATVILIEGADRFGLSQLHQLRGRVGRSKYQSYCFLAPSSSSEKTRERIKALTSCSDGFKLAEKDLEMRGPGDFFGGRQWGLPDFTMNSFSDLKLVEKVRQISAKLLEEDPGLVKCPLLKKKIEELRERVHFE